MQFKAPAGLLLETLSPFLHFLTNTGYLPFADCFFINADKNKLAFSSNNFRFAFECTLEGDKSISVTSTGQCAVRGKMLLDLLSLIDRNETVLVHHDGKSLQLKTTEGRYKIDTEPATNFSPYQVPAAGSEYKLNALALRGAVICLEGLCLSTVAKQAALQGVLFCQHGSTLHMVATDRIRLGLFSFEASTERPRAAVVPIAYLSAMKQPLSNIDGDVVLGFSGAHVYIKSTRFFTCSSLIDENFPEYLPLFKSSTETILPVPTRPVMRSLERLEVMMESKLGELGLNFDSGRLTIENVDQASMGNEVINVPGSNTTANLRIHGLGLRELLKHFPTECTFGIPEGNRFIYFKSKEIPSLIFVQSLIQNPTS